MENYGHSEFIDIILYDKRITPLQMSYEEIAKEMFKNLSILIVGHATLAIINVINRSKVVSHCFYFCP